MRVELVGKLAMITTWNGRIVQLILSCVCSLMVISLSFYRVIKHFTRSLTIKPYEINRNTYKAPNKKKVANTSQRFRANGVGICGIKLYRDWGIYEGQHYLIVLFYLVS